MMMILIFSFFIGLCHSRVAHTISQPQEISYPPGLVYPYGGTIKLLMGLAVPVEIQNRILVYGQNFQFQYALPRNTSIFTDSSTRRYVPFEQRRIVYKFFEDELQRWGFNGKSCLLKILCEVAAIPFTQTTLLDQLFQIIISPNYGVSPAVIDLDYMDAIKVGVEGNSCSVCYPKCPHNLLKWISQTHITGDD